MSYPISKIKNGASSQYTYRGCYIEVNKTYNFNREYVIGSTYYCPQFKVFSSNRKKFKVMMDLRINKEDSTIE